MKRLILIAALAGLTGCTSIGGAISAGGWVDGVYVQTQVVAPAVVYPVYPRYDYGPPRRAHGPYYQPRDPYRYPPRRGHHRHGHNCRH